MVSLGTWADGISFRAYGLRIGVRVNDAALLARVGKHLPYGSAVDDTRIVDHLYSLRRGVRAFHSLCLGQVRIARTPDLDELLETLESSMRRLVAEHSKRHVFIHAGVVGWGDRALLIPGSSFSGKTTLVAELVRAGAVYYSDEFAVLDARGRVHPYAQPLAIRENGAGGRQVSHAAEELGGVTGRVPLAVGAVLVTQYVSGGQWRPRPLSPGHTALALLNHAVAARSRPRAVLSASRAVASVAPGVRGQRGEARALAHVILQGAGEAFGSLPSLR